MSKPHRSKPHIKLTPELHGFWEKTAYALRIPKDVFDLGIIKKSIKYYAHGIYMSFDYNHVFLFGAGLAFSLLTCIIPFVLILFWVLGNFLNQISVEVQINTLIDTVIPYEAYSTYVKEILVKRIGELVRYKNVAGLVGLGGLLISASSFSSSIRTILNQIFGAREDVNVIIGKLRDFALIVVTIFIFFLMSFLLPILDMLRGFSQIFKELEFLQYGFFQKIFTSAISFTMLTIIFSVLYHFVPIVKIKIRALIIGALWAAGLWEGMKLIFGYYIANVATFGQIYGTYALIVVVAFWIYYSCVVFVFGAVIGKLYNDNPHRKNYLFRLKPKNESAKKTKTTEIKS